MGNQNIEHRRAGQGCNDAGLVGGLGNVYDYPSNLPLTKPRGRAIGLRINGRDLGFSPEETDGEVRPIPPAGSDSLAAEEQPN